MKVFIGLHLELINKFNKYIFPDTSCHILLGQLPMISTEILMIHIIWALNLIGQDLGQLVQLFTLTLDILFLQKLTQPCAEADSKNFHQLQNTIPTVLKPKPQEIINIISIVQLMNHGTDVVRLATVATALETNAQPEEHLDQIGYEIMIESPSLYQNMSFLKFLIKYMQIDSYLEDSLQTYSVLFNRCRFGFTSKINLENLKYFSIPNQQRLGKIDIRLNINAIRQLPNNKNFNYLVMTEYQQIIPLIYMLRSQPPNCKILTTKSMIQSAKIYAQDFYRVVKKMNQVVSTPAYEQQSEVYDNYEVAFQIDFSFWVNIFSKQEIINFVKRCVCLNYGQIHDTERGILITAYPSGISIGSAVWLFQNPLTKYKCLWVQGMSHHIWRACQQFHVNQIHQNIHNIIFTVGVLRNSITTIQDEHQCLQFLKTLSTRLSKGHNTRVVIHDFLVIADIINYVVFQFKDRFKKIFFTGCSANNLMSYVNSYVQFLTYNHQKRIYEEPPVYPFETYEQLREKNIAQGTLDEISAQNKIPVKELILRSTPYIQFESDFYAFLMEGENQVAETMFQKFYDLKKLREWLDSIKVNKITYLCKADEDLKNIPDLGHSFSLNLMGENIYLPDEGYMKYYTAEGPLPGLISQYTKRNGWLRLAPVSKRFRELKKNWHIFIENQLSKLGIQTLSKSQTELQTVRSKIFIKDYKIHIHSTSQKQLQIFDSLLSQCSKLFKLG